MSLSLDRGGLAAGLVSMVAFGLSGVWVRLVGGASPTFITALRLLIALGAALPFLMLGPRRAAFREVLGRRAAWGLAGLTVFYYWTAVIAYQVAPVGEVALMLSTSPLFALVFNRMAGVPARRREVVGAGVALVGVGLIAGPNVVAGLESAGGAARLWGDLIAFISAGAASYFSVFYRRLDQAGAAPDPFGVAVLTFVLGGFPLVALSLVLEPGGGAGPGAGPWLALLGLGLVSTLTPTVLYAVASQRLPSVFLTTARLLIPIFAAGFAAMILDELPSPWAVPGGLLVLFGLFYMTRPVPVRAK